MNLMERMVEQARANKQRIVLPEGTEERTLKAADRILADNIADVILIGNPDEIRALANQYQLTHIDQATLVNPLSHEKKETYTQLLYELRKAKGMTLAISSGTPTARAESTRLSCTIPARMACCVSYTKGSD